MIRTLLLEQQRRQNPAVLREDGAVSYGALARRAAAVRRRLAREPRGNTAILLPDGAAYIAAFFGTLSAGMTAVPLNPGLTACELASIAGQAEVQTVVTSASLLPLAEGIDGVRRIVMEDLPEEAGQEPPLLTVPAGEDAVLLATSGTTGRAKIVRLTEANIDASVEAYLECMDYEPVPEAEVCYTIATPLCAVYGILILCACVKKGFPMVFLEQPFTLDKLYRAAQQYRVTHYEGGVIAAVLMDQAAGRPVPYDVSSLGYFGLAGSKLPAATLRRLYRAFPGAAFWTGYGMTEAAPLICKPYKKMDTEKLDAVGPAVRGVTIMVEADGALTGAPETVGEIVVKGPNVMPGYYRNEEETRRVLRNGWLYTGDLGWLDRDGWLYLCGRKKNIIIVRGFNVHAEEVEACILASRLAGECVVYGEADEAGNEMVCADVVPSSASVTEEAVRAWCAAHLAAYKQPRRIRLVERVAKTATGKGRKEAGGGAD